MVDFIIVGRGLAATVLMHSFYRQNISFTVIGHENLSSCSRVAAGIWNPIVFKRMTSGWMAQELLTELMKFYPACEKTLQTKLITLRQIVKPFTENHEKELWKKKAAAELEPFLVESIQQNLTGLQGLKVPNEYGLVEAAGNLHVKTFLDSSSSFFRERVQSAVFDHNLLEINENGVSYGDVKAANIIFCEGHLVKNNPFFNWVPLKPAKGELITVKSEDIHLKNRVFNRDGFLMDLQEHEFRLGATYEWEKLDDKPTGKGLRLLERKLRNMTEAGYTVEKQEAGIRPASIDRRPVIGRHPYYERLFIFNGLGAKGVMLAPYFAGKFVLFWLKKQDLCSEADVRRFYHLYERA